MDKLIAGFSEQLRTAVQIGLDSNLPKHTEAIDNIVIAGLGGSGFGGLLVKEIMGDQLQVPLELSNSYFIPNYVNDKTLVILCSYSGNTEETLSAMNQALQKGSQIYAITSGGKLEESAISNQFPYIKIPSGMPPRACIGYSFVEQFFILRHCGLIQGEFESRILAAADHIDNAAVEIKEKAMGIAKKLVGKMPIIYAELGNQSLAIRMRQQLNENSKILCWHHLIPEMNHNELVGWRTKSEDWAVLFIRDEKDFHKNQKRIEINKTILSEYTNEIIELWTQGDDEYSRSIYMIHLIDWISVYLADLRGMDAVEVKVIDYLKSELAATSV